jgi:hypothetical protein
LSTTSVPARNSAPPATQRILRRVFSFPVVLVCFLAVLSVLSVRGRFDDPDMWWHLKNGEVIWTTHSIPTSDQYSYTTNHQASVPQEWMSEVSIYAAYRLGGYSGLMAWLCLLTSIMLGAGYLLCSLYSGNAKVSFLGAIIIWFFATVALAVRGQLVGYVFLILELLLVHLGRSRTPRWFWALPLLFVFWVNCHGSFFFGLVVLGIFLLASFFKFEAGSLVGPAWEKNQRRMLILASCLSVAVLFLNPVGWRQVAYPVNTILHQHIVVTQIQEWLPLTMTDPRGVGLWGILAFLALYLMARRSANLYLEEVLLLAAGAWLALSHQRMAIVFGILVAPAVSRILRNSWENYEAAKDRPAANAVCMVLAAVAVFFSFPSRQYLVRKVDSGSPVEAVEYIKTHNLSGNMLNTFVDGGYLIWALPEHPVFIDGRADIFEWTGVLKEFGEWATLQTDPNQLLNKYHIGFCLLENDSPMAYVLLLMPNWKKVYSDQKSVIFVRTDAGKQ